LSGLQLLSSFPDKPAVDPIDHGEMPKVATAYPLNSCLFSSSSQITVVKIIDLAMLLCLPSFSDRASYIVLKVSFHSFVFTERETDPSENHFGDKANWPEWFSLPLSSPNTPHPASRMILKRLILVLK
jgi:hypothetical protein